MAPPIDFQSQDGFRQAAKKGKKAAKATSKSKWDENEDENGSKKDEGEGGDGGDKGGDAGAGGGGDGDKKDDTNGNGDGADGAPEDDWDNFMPAKGKKKGKKGKAEDPAPAPAVVEKFDAFHEIKLDDTGPMLDLSFDTGNTSTKTAGSGFGSWGSSWNTGTTATTG
jgi:hypothetical protein